MANLLLALAFATALFYAHRMMDKLDRFLKSAKTDDEGADE